MVRYAVRLTKIEAEEPCDIIIEVCAFNKIEITETKKIAG